MTMRSSRFSIWIREQRLAQPVAARDRDTEPGLEAASAFGERRFPPRPPLDRAAGMLRSIGAPRKATNMRQPTILEAVTERDVDLLILEELAVSRDFLAWWLDRVEGEPGTEEAVVVRARHSVTHPRLGESDLVVVYARGRSDARAVLIENKLSAPPQPDQALRYRLRGEAGVATGAWASFRTCIIAPQRYLDATDDANLFDARIAYEAVRDWFRDRGADARAGFRASIVDQAIEQARRGYTPEADERVTRFWHRYWACAAEEFPELDIPEPGPKPGGATWIEARPEALGPGRRIYHKLAAGFVDLQLDGAAGDVEAIKDVLAPLLWTDTEVVATGKSASVRVRVPPLDPFAALGEQVAEARAGMRAAYRLLVLARAITAA
ncbi:MAG: hypothetical protein K0A98_08310 [Trueperaceae bacterium]|nr:hypothetical protein [Trueperaceae bacterium]